MSVELGCHDEDQYQRGVCMSKRYSPSVMHALNRGWLLCVKYGSRSAVYHCPVCHGYHGSRSLSGDRTVVCVYTGPAPQQTQQEKAA